MAAQWESRDVIVLKDETLAKAITRVLQSFEDDGFDPRFLTYAYPYDGKAIVSGRKP